jgi:hypothetical protein
VYKIIGADGKEYGPVPLEQLQQWIAQGRADAQTLTQAVGSTDWKPLGSYPEFGPAAPPVVRPASTPATNNMAVAGLVFGLLGLTGGWMCCGGPLFSVLGIVFSSIGLSQIKRNPTRETGRSIAITGLVLSILGMVAAVVIGIVFWTMGVMGHHPTFWHRQWRF